jgi:hypothetical protein
MTLVLRNGPAMVSFRLWLTGVAIGSEQIVELRSAHLQQQKTNEGGPMKQAYLPPCAANPKFRLGQLVGTPGAMRAVSRLEAGDAIARHVSGDWGELCEEDRAENEFGLAHSGRLFSVYYTENGTKFWVITESDRSVTTLLLPEEY